MQRRSALKAIGTTLGGATMSLETVAAEGQKGRIDETVPLTVEEQRVFNDYPQRILEHSGFDQFRPEFVRDLETAPNKKNARALVRRHGKQLWETAVARSQGRRPQMGELHPYDDRPLYWARLELTAALRQYRPSFSLSDDEHENLLKLLEYASRGITSTKLPQGGDGITRILVSGFDPFTFIWSDSPEGLRHDNPSGAAALQLNGRHLETEQGPVFVESVVFPVRWQDFDDGILEDAFGPRLQEDVHDMIMTISQGGRGIMDIEGWAGSWRGGILGSNLETREGYIPPAPGWPEPSIDDPFVPGDGRLEWVETTLPYREMMQAAEEPWPIVFDDRGWGWPAPHEGSDPRLEPVDESRIEQFGQMYETLNGDVNEHPPEGMLAYSGPGGNYLSNESQYRSNRLRMALGKQDMPGGHLHVSGVKFADENTSRITDSHWERELEETVDQIVDLVRTAGAANE